MTYPVCDSCLTAAYDEGFRGLSHQASIMYLMGADLPDHLCDEVETNGEVKCSCGCRRS